MLFPGTADGIEALGFIAAGPWDFIGHAELPETKIDGKIARHLDRDDMVANTIGTFMSLTVHCAQCHNHKFDPIPQEDYYRLQAVFAAIDRTDKAVRRGPEGRGAAGRTASGCMRGASAVARVGRRGAAPPSAGRAAAAASRVRRHGPHRQRHVRRHRRDRRQAAADSRPAARRRDEAAQGGRPRRDRGDSRHQRPLRAAAEPRRRRAPRGAGEVAHRRRTTR